MNKVDKSLPIKERRNAQTSNSAAVRLQEGFVFCKKESLAPRKRKNLIKRPMSVKRAKATIYNREKSRLAKLGIWTPSWASNLNKIGLIILGYHIESLLEELETR